MNKWHTRKLNFSNGNIPIKKRRKNLAQLTWNSIKFSPHFLQAIRYNEWKAWRFFLRGEISRIRRENPLKIKDYALEWAFDEIKEYQVVFLVNGKSKMERKFKHLHIKNPWFNKNIPHCECKCKWQGKRRKRRENGDGKLKANSPEWSIIVKSIPFSVIHPERIFLSHSLRLIDISSSYSAVYQSNPIQILPPTNQHCHSLISFIAFSQLASWASLKHKKKSSNDVNRDRRIETTKKK